MQMNALFTGTKDNLISLKTGTILFAVIKFKGFSNSFWHLVMHLQRSFSLKHLILIVFLICCL